MLEQYPQIQINYIDEDKYMEIQKEYSKLIPNWEFKIKKSREEINNECDK